MTASEKEIVWGDQKIRESRVDHLYEHAGDADIDRLVEQTAPESTDRVLDLICGLGHVARAFAPHVNHVDAYDPDPEIIMDAMKLTEKSGIENINFISGDVHDLNFENNIYDIVAARLAVRHLGDPSYLLGHARRILRPSGRLIFSDMLASPHPDLAEFQANLMILRDPSHIRSYSLAEIEINLERENFNIDVIEIYPMEHNFESWAKRLGAKNENVRMLARTLQGAGDRVRRHFRVVEKDEKLISFVTWMIMIVAKPTPDG